jgi:hypothetical protein
MRFDKNASVCLSSRRALGWFLTSLDKMKLKNFRPKQILVCEAFLAISYHKNKMDEEAYDYFMKSLESKSKSLPDHILFDFLRCGMNTLTNLKKKEELVQFHKIKFQFRNDVFSMNYVNDLTELFEADWESNGYKNVDESPYFQDVIKVFLFCFVLKFRYFDKSTKTCPIFHL